MARHLSFFGSTGLRTLVFAKRVLPRHEAERWLETFRSAQTALSEREALLAAAAEEVETTLTLVGASAIEDKLQEGVPQTIQALQQANIKVWMLTGDKQETAINIGHASSLLDERMQACPYEH
jgi:magnesium-transporting ATPase (P-type)